MRQGDCPLRKSLSAVRGQAIQAAISHLDRDQGFGRALCGLYALPVHFWHHASLGYRIGKLSIIGCRKHFDCKELRTSRFQR